MELLDKGVRLKKQNNKRRILVDKMPDVALHDSGRIRGVVECPDGYLYVVMNDGDR